MPELKVAELDALAEEHGVAGYPFDANKPEKIAALEAAGVELVAPEAAPVYRLQLRDGVEEASFQAGWTNVTLTAADPVFETIAQREYLQARELPFLEEAD